MIDRCNGCGRKDVPTVTFRCDWPDGRATVEQHCEQCRRTWHRQLIGLGAKLTEVVPPGTPARGLRLEPPSLRSGEPPEKRDLPHQPGSDRPS